VSGRADWSYAQTRLQARHGARLDEGDWRVLEAARSLDHYLDRSRATSLRRFADRLNAQMSSHAIERTLRAEWRRYVAEVAAWAAPAWQPAVMWVAPIPYLPVLDHLLTGDGLDWMRDDPILARLADVAPQKRIAILEDSALAPFSPANEAGGTLEERWLAHWRALWPQRCALDCQWLDKLAETVAHHFERIGRAGPQETSDRYRQDLARTITRVLRRRSGTPVALFAHLALLALDLERFRGGLLRRRLFVVALAEQAA
jgi:hypothetical protein